MFDWLKQIDWAVLWWFQSVHGEWTDGPMRDVTALGGITVTVLVLVVAGTTTYLLGQWRTGAVLLGTVAVTTILVAGLKLAIGRERPPTDPTPFYSAELVPPHMPSFPSGHTATAVVVWTSLALMFPPHLLKPSRRFYATVLEPIPVRGFLVGAALVLAAAVGVSRLYLGAHWLFDVLAGYPLGCAIVAVEAYILYRLGDLKWQS